MNPSAQDLADDLFRVFKTNEERMINDFTEKKTDMELMLEAQLRMEKSERNRE